MGIYFSIFAIILSIIIIICFFTRKDEYTHEKGAFAKLLGANFFGLIIEIARQYISSSTVSMVALAIVNKFYLIYIMFFILLFSLYIFTICYKCSTNPKIKYFNLLKILAYIAFTVIAFAVALMPMVANGTELIGSSVNIMYVYSFVWICVWIIAMIKNISKMQVKKFIPVAAMIVLMGIVSYFQKEYIDLAIFAALHTIVLFISLFTMNSGEVLKSEAEEASQIKTEESVEMPTIIKEKVTTSKEGLISNVSDYMISSLKSILNSSNRILKSDISDTVRVEINNISLQSQALLNIAEGISDVSKMDTYNVEMVDGEYSIRDVVKNVVMLTKAFIGNQPIDFKFSIDPDLPDYLYGDVSKIEQICLDLLTNAIKNTNEGRIELKIDSISKADVCRLIISVSDTGVGMKKEEIDKIFDKKDSYTNEDGFVLAVTKELVENMNGKIVVESEYGAKSKFIVAIDQKIIKR